MSSESKLRVTSLQVRDVLGAREFAVEPGRVTVLSGRNASGKTTVLESLKSVVGGGNLARLARIPGDPDEEIDPEIVLVLREDGGREYRVEKTSKATRLRAQVGDSAGYEDVPQPQRWLSGLFDTRLSNPLEFLRAPDKDRVLLLLGALPVELDRERLHADMGIDLSEIAAVPAGLHPLQELAYLREAVFRERTGVNRDAKQKASTAEQTLRATPAVLPDGHEAEIEELDRRVTEADREIAEQTATERRDHRATVEQKRAEEQRAAERKRADLEAEIAKMRTALEAEIAERAAEVQAEIDEAVAHHEERTAAFAERQREIDEDRHRLFDLREQAKAAIKAQTLRDQAEQFEAEAEELRERSGALTRAIEALDRYRRELADDLPISGLAVEGKEITVDGVPFDQVNTARQIEIAVKVACLRAKDQRLPIVWVDGAEALDSENFEALVAALKAEGVQAFIGAVRDSDLTTEVEA